MVLRAALNNLIGENDKLKKRCRHDECPAYAPLNHFFGTRASAKLNAVGFSNHLFRSIHRGPSLSHSSSQCGARSL